MVDENTIYSCLNTWLVANSYSMAVFDSVMPVVLIIPACLYFSHGTHLHILYDVINALIFVPVLGWQNVALSSLGSVCEATFEYNSDYLCEKALDGLTDVISQWATRGVGAGVSFCVRHFI